MVQDLKDISDRLEIWRKERGLDKSQGFEFDLNIQVSFAFEEIGVEHLRAKSDYEKIDSLCDLTVFHINTLSFFDTTDKEIVDFSSLIDTTPSVFSILNNCSMVLSKPYLLNPFFIENIFTARMIIEDMGYDYFKCMNETLKEVESRKGAFNSESGKWEKFKDEESQKLWYKADYNSCKIVA